MLAPGNLTHRPATHTPAVIPVRFRGYLTRISTVSCDCVQSFFLLRRLVPNLPGSNVNLLSMFLLALSAVLGTNPTLARYRLHGSL